jgi:glycosyltransferase involved in cell wall biosynthesis
MTLSIMGTKPLTLSIVIPVYNEERYLKSCLDSIAKQTVKADEVIVVDNNSTDKSVEIAKKYNFVTILHEKRQHQSFAQKKGFDSSKSDILGRIDGDSILPIDWVEKVKLAFAQDDRIVGVTGGVNPYDVKLKWLGIAIFHGYIYLAGVIAGTRLLWGANCAIRASAWGRVKNQVLLRPDIWEDYDMSFCLNGVGKIKYLRGIKVSVSYRAIRASFTNYTRYQFRSVRTFYLRANYVKTILFVLLWTTTFIGYLLAVIDDWLLGKKVPENHGKPRA